MRRPAFIVPCLFASQDCTDLERERQGSSSPGFQVHVILPTQGIKLLPLTVCKFLITTSVHLTYLSSSLCIVNVAFQRIATSTSFSAVTLKPNRKSRSTICVVYQAALSFFADPRTFYKLVIWTEAFKKNAKSKVRIFHVTYSCQWA